MVAPDRLAFGARHYRPQDRVRDWHRTKQGVILRDNETEVGIVTTTNLGPP